MPSPLDQTVRRFIPDLRRGRRARIFLPSLEDAPTRVKQMTFTFKYRYVDFGTVFTGALGIRSAENGAESPSTLYANELVTDVGGTCWDRNEPLAIIDHHFSRDGQFPSASAAVLHKAKLIREKFASQQNNVLWLVTHQQPDFDAFCSLYLARWVVEDMDAAIDWELYGLHPDGWIDSAGKRKIDWFDPDINQVPLAQRWALLLASYASIIDNSRHLSCPRQRALHSVLYAALKRGRDYLNETSGAREFFDEIKVSLQEKRLNPMVDSVLEGSSRFAPELSMLDREVEAYHRDIHRARKSIVYLPESEAPFPNFFKSVRDVSLAKEKEPDRSLETNVDRLLLADTFRIPTDGIYLRDPECLLFKEWARLDLGNSALGSGFEFTAIAYSGGHPAATVNQSDYVFSIDPERATGRHLYTVWSRLQTKEVEALRVAGQSSIALENGFRRGSEAATEASSKLFTDPWFDGHNCFGTIVAAPHRGTHIGPAGVRSDLRDDSVAEAVRTELENALYLAESPTEGPQVILHDFGGPANMSANVPLALDLDAPQLIPPPHEGYFRFGSIPLRADVPISSGHNLSGQIAETLWQVLYPDLPYDKPADFVERHVVVTADCVGIWGQRGIVVARKLTGDASRPGEDGSNALRDDFAGLVALTSDIGQLIADGEQLTQRPPPSTLPGERSAGRRNPRADWATTIVAKSEELMRRAAQVTHNLALPDRELLRRFYDAMAVDGLLATLRDLNQSAAGYLSGEQLAEQARRMEEGTKTAVAVQRKVRWLAVFVVGCYATEMLDLSARPFRDFDNTWGMPFVLLGGLFSLLLAAWIIKPWQRRDQDKLGTGKLPTWIIAVVMLSYIVGLLLWLTSPHASHP
jgi:hypothetical protein